MKPFLWTLCVAVPGVCVWLGGFVTLWVVDRLGRLPQHADGWLLCSVLTAIPFVALALWYRRVQEPIDAATRAAVARAAWVGVAINLLTWSLVHGSYYDYVMAGERGGADIASGCIVLLGPVVVGIAMWSLLRPGRRTRQPAVATESDGDGVLRGLDAVAWDRFPQPSWNSAGEVPAALRALADGADLDRHRAWNRMLYAIGNNHCGSYFPVLLPCIPFFGEILGGTVLVARLRTLDVLNDIVASFHPDPQHEEIDSPSGRRPLQAAMLAEVAKLVPQLTRLRSSSESSEEAKLAADTLQRLDG